MITDFSSETLEAGRQRNDIFKTMKEKSVKPDLYI